MLTEFGQERFQFLGDSLHIDMTFQFPGEEAVSDLLAKFCQRSGSKLQRRQRCPRWSQNSGLRDVGDLPGQFHEAADFLRRELHLF